MRPDELAQHEGFMRRALELAERGRWSTAPNPTVGAVLVKDGAVAAEGWHQVCGQAHAEVNCLRDAAAKGVDPAGGTLYVTLEPCNHFGKTPPCSHAVLEAGISRVVNGIAPDLIYLPERNFSKEEFFEDVREALKKHPNVVIAVSEGIHFADGTYVCEGFGVASTDAFGHKQLSGTGKALEYAVKAELGCKVRSIELNLPQRCGAHIASATDLAESVCVGRAAVKAASEGVTREMMIIVRDSTEPYAYHVEHSDVSKIANQIKAVPAEFINARGNNVTDECARYLLPLIAGEAGPVYENGLPKYLIIE